VFLPKRIEALKGIQMASVAAGDDHALALTNCGRVYSWGENSRHALGQGLESDVLGQGLESDVHDDIDCCPSVDHGSPRRACAGHRGWAGNVMRRDRYWCALHVG
jgi:alpha-tubulin suppressor-like RCC1 family protein